MKEVESVSEMWIRDFKSKFEFIRNNPSLPSEVMIFKARSLGIDNDWIEDFNLGFLYLFSKGIEMDKIFKDLAEHNPLAANTVFSILRLSMDIRINMDEMEEENNGNTDVSMIDLVMQSKNPNFVAFYTNLYSEFHLIKYYASIGDDNTLLKVLKMNPGMLFEKSDNYDNFFMIDNLLSHLFANGKDELLRRLFSSREVLEFIEEHSLNGAISEALTNSNKLEFHISLLESSNLDIKWHINNALTSGGFIKNIPRYYKDKNIDPDKNLKFIVNLAERFGLKEVSFGEPGYNIMDKVVEAKYINPSNLEMLADAGLSMSGNQIDSLTSPAKIETIEPIEEFVKEVILLERNNELTGNQILSANKILFSSLFENPEIFWNCMVLCPFTKNALESKFYSNTESFISLSNSAGFSATITEEVSEILKYDHDDFISRIESIHDSILSSFNVDIPVDSLVGFIDSIPVPIANSIIAATILSIKFGVPSIAMSMINEKLNEENVGPYKTNIFKKISFAIESIFGSEFKYIDQYGEDAINLPSGGIRLFGPSTINGYDEYSHIKMDECEYPDVIKEIREFTDYKICCFYKPDGNKKNTKPKREYRGTVNCRDYTDLLLES